MTPPALAPSPAPAPAPAPAPSSAPAPTSFDATPVPAPAPTLAPAPGITTRFRVAPADQPLLDRTLAEARRSPTAAPIMAQLEQASKVQLQVLDDARFEQLDKGGSAAFYDPTGDTIYLRRSWLEKSPAKAASVLAHEAQHALDDQAGVGQAALQRRTLELARGGAVTEEVVKQAGFEVNIAKEARGYLVQGLVLRELGLGNDPGVGGPLKVAALGANDRATYDAVFRLIVSSPEGGYNPEGRRAEPFVL